MKKIAFSLVLVLAAAISFTACQPEVNLKDNIIKNKIYNGVDNSKKEWLCTFNEATFTGTSGAISMIATSWQVTPDASDKKKGTIVLKGVTATTPNGTNNLEDITGTVTKSGNEIVLTSGKTTITLTKK